MLCLLPISIIPAIIIVLLFVPTAESLLQYQKLNVVKNHNYVFKYNNYLQMRLNPTSFPGTEYTITEFPRPSLRRIPNVDITKFDDVFQAKTQEMMTIMYESKGVGLAAPQIGLNENFFVYNPSGSNNDSKSMERIVCNPNITQYSKDIDVEKEGCLSLRSDDCAGQVARSSWIETTYQNELGQKIRRRLKGFEARVFQHEYDHLKGILCYDRFPPEDREEVQKNINYLLGLYTEDDALIEPNSKEVQMMQPRPLLAKRMMPPLQKLEEETTNEEDDEEEEVLPKKQNGFGGAGFGAGGNKKKISGGNKKKEKKKKVKVRNGILSSNPTFK